jgi:hypothetical protein
MAAAVSFTPEMSIWDHIMTAAVLSPFNSIEAVDTYKAFYKLKVTITVVIVTFIIKIIAVSIKIYRITSVSPTWSKG